MALNLSKDETFNIIGLLESGEGNFFTIAKLLRYAQGKGWTDKYKEFINRTNRADLIKKWKY